MPTEIWADLDFKSTSRITNLPAPASANEPARLADLNSAVEGLSWKDSARVATQANLNLASPGATIDGITMVAGDRVLVRSQTTAAENGIYIWNGAAVAMTRALDASTSDELEQAVVTVEEGTSAGATFRQTAVNFTLGSGSVAFTAFGTSAAAASETTSGIAEIATQAETDAGTDDLRIVTPLKMATWSGRKRKLAQAIGDGSATQFDVTHNFGTRDVVVEVYRNSGNYDTIQATVSRPTVNAVRINFATGNAPTTNQFVVVVTA